MNRVDDQLFSNEFFQGKSAFRRMVRLSATLAIIMTGATGCSNVSRNAAGSAIDSTTLSISPSAATIAVGQTIQLSVLGTPSDSPCQWASSDPSVLTNSGTAEFEGMESGSVSVSVSCGGLTSAATLKVVSQSASGPIRIDRGGVYSGTWTSTNPGIPAVLIETNEPVTIQNSVISSSGDLIKVSGSGSGANVQIVNVTGTAIAPKAAGLHRGRFVVANSVASLLVKNCSIYGTSFGVIALDSQLSSLQILNNLAVNLEDRASDGKGGLQPAGDLLGHFVILDKVVAPEGAEIAWNQVVQTIGKSSTEDVINIYRSKGSAGHPIWVHDNYMEGFSSTTLTTGYDGAGVIADGSATEPVTAFALFEGNDVVHTAGSGIVIGNGHDIIARSNRVVSCGQDSSGNWFAMPFANAVSLFDYYKTGPTLFYNNSIDESAGGLIRPNTNGNAMVADSWANQVSLTYPGISLGNNQFTNPCLSNGSLYLEAEDNERAYWKAKVAAADEMIGDQH